MNAKILIAGVAVAALTAVGAQAASSHKAAANAGAYAEPAQPIAYSSIGTYLKASPTARKTRDWSGGTAAAASNAGSNVSATTPPAADATPAPAADASAPAAPAAVSPPVNPAAAQAPADNAQPPAANAPAPTDQPAPTAPQ